MDNTLIKIKTFFSLLNEGFITPRKIRNLILVRLSLLLKKPKVWGIPYTLTIEPTNVCNLKCPLCPTGKGTLGRKNGFMDFDLYKKIIDEVSPYLFNILLTTWGEPFLHKDIYKMIEYAKNKKIKVTVMTNGHFFDSEEQAKKLINSQLDRLLLDLDGADQETLIKYKKNADFNKIINGIHRIVKEKEIKKAKNPEIELQFVVMKHNEHQIDQMKELAKNLGVDLLVLKSVRVNDEEEAKQYIPANKKLSRYFKGIERNKKIKKGCSYLWTVGLVYWNGDVCLCCYDHSGKYILGNVKEEPFSRAWNNPKFQVFRKQILKDKAKFLLCKNCPGGDENFDIERIAFKK